MTTTTKQTAAARPTHRLYSVTGTGKSASWTEIGAAWPNKDGKGFAMSLLAVPVNGRVVMRVIVEHP